MTQVSPCALQLATLPAHVAGLQGSQSTHPGITMTPPSDPDLDPFSEFLWMENEEEFEQEVMKQLEEEALMEECIQAMLEDEREAIGDVSFFRLNNTDLVSGLSQLQLTDEQDKLKKKELVNKSKLNPNAAEFVPTSSRANNKA